MQWFLVSSLLALLVGAGCSRPAEANSNAEPAGAPTPSPGRKAAVTPELAQKAEALLSEHGAKSIGSEHPFTLSGKRYVARVEEHDNTTAVPGRPAGKHKGITVYEAP